MPASDGGAAEAIPLTASALGELYPVIARRVRSALASFGAPEHLVDDLLSEAVARALARGVAIRNADDLAAWLVTVARRLYLDALRGARREIPEKEAALLPAADDPANDAAARVLLTRTLAAIATLSERDRTALLWRPPEGTNLDRRAAVRLAVRRHRVRVRVRRMVGLLVLLTRP